MVAGGRRAAAHLRFASPDRATQSQRDCRPVCAPAEDDQRLRCRFRWYSLRLHHRLPSAVRSAGPDLLLAQQAARIRRAIDFLWMLFGKTANRDKVADDGAQTVDAGYGSEQRIGIG